MFKFNLGDKVRDRITGFEGIILGRTEWMTGCRTYGVKSQALKDSSPIDAVWLDEIQLDLVMEQAVALHSHERPITGGPTPTPTRNIKGM